MSELLFKVRGAVVPANLVSHHAVPAPPRATKEREAQHMGFAVEGFAPNLLIEAEARAKKDRVLWGEEAFLRKTKRRRVAKPFSMPQAAADCMQLAIRAGWTHVVIKELVRGAA